MAVLVVEGEKGEEISPQPSCQLVDEQVGLGSSGSKSNQSLSFKDSNAPNVVRIR